MIRWFRRKKKEEVVEELPLVEESTREQPQADLDIMQQMRIERQKVDVTNHEERIAYITYLHDQIKEAKYQSEEAKFEYGQVTSYLKDIQLIDQADEESRKVLTEIAEGIYELTKERENLQKQHYKITDRQRTAIESYEGEITRDLKNIKEYEEYQIRVKNDLRSLRGEKNMLLRDKKDIISKQRTLKVLAQCSAGILIGMGTMIAAMHFLFKMDVVIPFVAVVAFVFVAIAYISYQATRNRTDMVKTEKQVNRATFLLNRVKIKYVNNVKAIEYICAKYNVRNGIDLDFVYGQYLKAKAEWNRQQEGTRVLGEYNQVLLSALKRLGVKDREIWFFQTEALVDAREMVEVRHRLNERRRNLRDRMDYNADVMEEALNEMEQIRSRSEEYKEDVEIVLGK